MKNLMTRLFREEEGQGMVEYALIVAAVALIAFAGYHTLGMKIKTKLDEISKILKDIATVQVEG